MPALQLPAWMLFVRIAQAVLTVITLGLTAFSASVWGVFSGYALNWFTCVWTWAFLGFTLVVRPRLTNINPIFPLIPEVATAFWWLVSFSVIASEASSLSGIEDLYNAYVGEATDGDYSFSYGSRGNAALGCTKGAAAAGALVLYVS
jgi:Membrane-associating domain